MHNQNVKYLKIIRDKVGVDIFRKIVAEIPNAAVRFPNDPEYFDKLDRNEQIRKDRYAGMEISELAKKYNLSESWIYKITE